VGWVVPAAHCAGTCCCCVHPACPVPALPATRATGHLPRCRARRYACAGRGWPPRAVAARYAAPRLLALQPLRLWRGRAVRYRGSRRASFEHYANLRVCGDAFIARPSAEPGGRALRQAFQNELLPSAPSARHRGSAKLPAAFLKTGFTCCFSASCLPYLPPRLLCTSFSTRYKPFSLPAVTLL